MEFKSGEKVRVLEAYYKNGGNYDIWRKTNKNTIFKIVEDYGTSVGLNCDVFEEYFGNKDGLSMERKYVIKHNQFNCKHGCPQCNNKCDLYEKGE
jgi:hypothetical protein